MSYTVEAVSKAIELLMLVAEQGGLGVTELAKRSGNTKARAFRLLATLEEGGLVQRTMPAATYSLGYRALVVGTAAQAQLSLVKVANSLLPQIGEACNESVLVRVRDGSDTICVAWWDAKHALRVHSQLGDRLSLGAGASGKLLLAHAPEAVQEEIMSGKLPRYTANTIANRADLKKALKKILADGYSMSISERAADTMAIAAPIRDASGQVVASLSMTAPVTRVTAKDAPRYRDIILASADQLSRALGFQ